jgi:hypothetical protein
VIVATTALTIFGPSGVTPISEGDNNGRQQFVLMLLEG